MSLKNLLIKVLVVLLLAGCGSGINTPVLQKAGVEGVAQESGSKVIPGEATLAGGARLLSNGDVDYPLPSHPPQPGVDFASNRLVVIFEEQPTPKSLAPFLGNSNNADAILATDNMPLVQHPYFRKVSHNLAEQYGLNKVSRVFYGGVNFAVFEMPTVRDMAELDAMMLKVLNENVGLVREVVYDMYAQLDELELVEFESSDELGRAFVDNPVGYHTYDHTGSVKATSITAPNDPYYQNRSGSSDSETGQGTWGLWRMGITHDQAWDYSTGSSDVVVAVVDTGTRISHEDLVDNCIDAANTPPYNEPGIHTDVYYKDNVPNDGHGHGTFCAGEVGAKGNNGLGLAGVCWDVSILPIKVLSNSGGGSQAQAAEGMLLADYLGANIITMSLGWDFPVRLLQLASQQCVADGMLVCTSAGNNNDSGPHYPSYYPACFSVGATTLVNDSESQDFSLVDGELPIDTRFDARTYFSCFGGTVDIAAPGYSTLSTSKTSDTSYGFSWAGTSMSTPYVAGVAALLWSYVDDPTGDSIRALLQSSATEMTHVNAGVDPKGFVSDTSNGHVRFCNGYEAIQLYDGGPYTAPTASWDNPMADDTVTGVTELRLDVTEGTGSIMKVEFETLDRLIAVVPDPDTGYFRFDWDSSFEFNGFETLIAKVYDDKGYIVEEVIEVEVNNAHIIPPYTEDFTGVANDTLPSSWFMFDENAGTNTTWGATDDIGSAAAPSMHSSGTTADYVAASNDWLVAPVIDLRGFAAASLTFERRYDRESGDYMHFIATDNDRDFDSITWSDQGLTAWEEITYDLSAFAGGEVRLMWVLDADRSSSSVAGGLWIDDIEISVASGTAPTLTIDSPLNGATVSGMVEVEVTVSDDVEALEVRSVPPLLGSLWYNSIPDNDPAETKTFTFYWDSRHVYNGGSLLTVIAYDDEDGDGELNDFTARADVSLSVNNAQLLPTWHEDFESITTLGGTIGTSFDGDWYTWSSGTSQWRINTAGAHTGSNSAKMGPEDSGDYGNHELDQLYSPMLDLTSATRPHLRVWQQLDVAADEDDAAKILLVRYFGIEDSEMMLADLRTDTSPADTWVAQIFDLTEYKAQPLRFNFVFDSNGDGDAGAGWLVDNIEVIDANPTISSISDDSRGVVGSTRTISGSNFGYIQGASSVSFAADGGGTTGATVNSWSDASIEVVVPGDAVSGNVKVTVLGYDSNGYDFRVILEPPVLTGLEQQ